MLHPSTHSSHVSHPQQTLPQSHGHGYSREEELGHGQDKEGHPLYGHGHGRDQDYGRDHISEESPDGLHRQQHQQHISGLHPQQQHQSMHEHLEYPSHPQHPYPQQHPHPLQQQQQQNHHHPHHHQPQGPPLPPPPPVQHTPFHQKHGSLGYFEPGHPPAHNSKLVRSHSHSQSQPHLRLSPYGPHSGASHGGGGSYFTPAVYDHHRGAPQMQYSHSLPITVTSPPPPLPGHPSMHHGQDFVPATEATMDSDNGGSSDGESCEGDVQWTRQEDNLLREAVVKFSGKAWKRIAEYCFPDGSRDKDQCLQRWRMISKPRSIKGPWTPEEDRQLRALVKELGAEKWVQIAGRLGSRTGKQCRERWHNHLDPKIDKSPFTAKEDELIFKLFGQFGSKWAEMSKLMPGRPDNAIKNHFNTSMQRKRRRLSLQDPSELQIKFSDGGSGPLTSATSPLASPTMATSPSLGRSNRFDPYERRHSMPSLELSPKALPSIPHGFSALHRQERAHDGSPENGSNDPHKVLTPPITPDTKGNPSKMARSVSLGSNRPMAGMPPTQPTINTNPSQIRPNLPGFSTIHKSGRPYLPLNTSSSGSAPSPTTPHGPSKLTRSVSAMNAPTMNNAAQSPYLKYPEEPYSEYQQQQFRFQQQERQLHHSLPRPNLTRHESLGQGGRPILHHEHRRSLDMDPFSALAELANLAEQCQELPTGGGDQPHSPMEMQRDHPRVKDEHPAREDNSIEEEVIRTMVSKGMGRRFSTLDHLKEEDMSDEHGSPLLPPQPQPQPQHSYYIEERKPTADSLSWAPLTRGGHPYSDSHSHPHPPPAFESGRSSATGSTSDQGSDQEDQQQQERSGEKTSHPSASYLAMRRGSVRELMAIDHLCLSSEEIQRR